ncbi:tyrosinase-like [Xenia sp. Carnegie-2017]|uniref:tyrosinase-like n=1 Tax=Xenia sp. Carnegie-2017 TaxID=2897299 RepID=UPI001F039028|nr:tyrosinase-like [Xenia sp. Carnegie-2017]
MEVFLVFVILDCLALPFVTALSINDKTNCRVRKEFNDLTEAERIRYTTAVITASTDTLYKKKYETLLTIHKDYFNRGIHKKRNFLPWHRWFVLQYENLLREIDDDFTMPYWDWSLEAGEPFTSHVWDTSKAGLGGDGQATTFCVQTGLFREHEWLLPSAANTTKLCLRRRFNGVGLFPTRVDMNLLLKKTYDQFDDFEILLRTYHNNVHCYISGTMCLNNAGFAPEFFLHHGFVDKTWWDWQNKGKHYKFNTYFMDQTSYMPMTRYYPKEFLDSKKLPTTHGPVCVEYKKPRNQVYEKLKGMPSRLLWNIERPSLPPLSIAAIKLFKVQPHEIIRMEQLRENLQQHLSKTISFASLHGRNAKFGFNISSIRS